MRIALTKVFNFETLFFKTYLNKDAPISFQGCLLKRAILSVTVINQNENCVSRHLAAACTYIEALSGSNNRFANSQCSTGTLAIPVSMELLPLLS